MDKLDYKNCSSWHTYEIYKYKSLGFVQVTVNLPKKVLQIAVPYMLRNAHVT